MLNALTLGLSTLLLGVIPTPTLAVTIDLFSDEQDFLEQEGVGSLSSSITAISEASIIGLERELTVEVISGDRFAFAEVIDGVAFLETGFLTQSRINFTWDGEGNSGLGGKDLTINEHNAFELNVGYIDQTVDLIFDVRDTLGNSGTIGKTGVSNPGSIYFNYDDVSNNNVDFTSIDSISLQTADEPDGLTFGFELVQTANNIPLDFSPSLGIIIFGGLLSLSKIRKKLQSH